MYSVVVEMDVDIKHATAAKASSQYRGRRRADLSLGLAALTGAGVAPRIDRALFQPPLSTRSYVYV